MSSASKRRRILAIVATDRTFRRTDDGGQGVWTGKCVHCQRWLRIGADGEPISAATIEHIVPRHHGGTDELSNLALACARCNAGKGLRHDHRRRGDEGLERVIATLQRRRRQRWRDPT